MSVIKEIESGEKSALTEAKAKVAAQVEKFSEQAVKAHFWSGSLGGTKRNQLNVASLTASELEAIKAGVAGKKLPELAEGDSADTIAVCVARCKELGITP